MIVVGSDFISGARFFTIRPRQHAAKQFHAAFALIFRKESPGLRRRQLFRGRAVGRVCVVRGFVAYLGITELWMEL